MIKQINYYLMHFNVQSKQSKIALSQPPIEIWLIDKNYLNIIFNKVND
ncbi:hypothetical protein pb186bvf_001357 [Paramecium bursaria]